MDVPFANAITMRQRSELIAIHQPANEDRPAWFNILADWEKKWFLNYIPSDINENENWQRFENLYQSSAMTHIPGIKNAHMNYLLMQDDTNKTFVASRSFKMSTMVPYEMPENNRKAAAEQTAEQVLGHLAKESLENFRARWGNLNIRPDLRPLIFCQGLLSDTVFGGNDNQLMAVQRQAINRQRIKQQFFSYTILTANDPVNFLRYVAAEQGLLSRMVGRWSHVDEILNYSTAFQVELAKKPLNAAQKENLKLIQAAHKELADIHKNSHLPRLDKNFAAYKTAYIAILAEALGGAVATNCKSGKDRTGLDELYRNTMYQYFFIHGKLPTYHDNEQESKQFADLYAKNFNSMKIQESAALNTPGSFGIKDDAMMLCRYIAKFLGISYICSNLRACMNKPGIFSRDAVAEAAEIRKRDTEAKQTKSLRVPILMADPKPEQWQALADQRQKILKIMDSLDEYIHDTTAGNKKSAAKFYRVLDHMNKRIQQAEAIPNEFNETKLSALLANISTNYTQALDTFTRNRVKRFAGILVGKKTRYDAILNDARMPLPESGPKSAK